MKQYNEFVLIEHLQVLDEPLLSLYLNRDSGKYFISVRLYEDIEDKSYLFSEVEPTLILKYMSRQLGLKALFKTEVSFYYRYNGQQILSIRKLISLSHEESSRKLYANCSLDDMYDVHLAYRSTYLKRYLSQKISLLKKV